MRRINLGAILKGTSGDSFFLILVRVVTLALGILITRVLSGHFSLQEYGTYSQIMLLVSTISSMTMLGMMDGVNFFFCKESDEQKRNTYVSTIFFLQYAVSAIVSLIVLACTVPISNYFGNEALRALIIFAALLPVLQNSISLLQIMFIAIGKARQIALRNLLVSLLKLAAVTLSCYVFDNVAVIFFCQVITDGLQVAYFVITLRKNDCRINVLKFDKSLIKEILIYCIPMAMFSVIKSLNRDSDKFVISFFTNTETLAIYTNASKLLPFDIIMTSFCTVLLPYVTRYIAKQKHEQCQTLYKSFLELSYIATTILTMGAICVAPQLMRFLYTEKYVSSNFGLTVFVIYLLADIVSVMNITMILSAAGKTKTILLASIGPFLANILLNVLLFLVLGEIGPAIATLTVTVIQGIIILSLSAKELKSNFFKMFNLKYLTFFVLQILLCSSLAISLQRLLAGDQVHYLIILFAVYALFTGALLLSNFRRLLKNLKIINSCKAER